MFSFSWQASRVGRARLGTIQTPHGTIKTPAFIFCATKASLKAMPGHELKNLGTQIILSNTYHLMIQPGAELVQKMGGLSKFTGWKGPTLTDSGGFQIFSLGHGGVAQEIKGQRQPAGNKSLLKITEEGARFRSYRDGKQWLLTPEKSIEIQRGIGADLILVLDECTPFHVDKAYTRRSMEMSHRWAVRSQQEFARQDDGSQSLYGIIQGGVYQDLRRESIDFVNQQPFFGSAIGGSLGADSEQMYEVVRYAAPLLRTDRPIHLLGIGHLRDILEGVEQGIDTFDCVHPTRIARHGGALMRGRGAEHVNLKREEFREDPRPILEDCGCPTCSNYSRSYLHHLIKAKELLVMHLLTVHNIWFMNEFLADIRAGIAAGSLEPVRSKWLPQKSLQS